MMETRADVAMLARIFELRSFDLSLRESESKSEAFATDLPSIIKAISKQRSS